MTDYWLLFMLRRGREECLISRLEKRRIISAHVRCFVSPTLCYNPARSSHPVLLLKVGVDSRASALLDGWPDNHRNAQATKRIYFAGQHQTVSLSVRRLPTLTTIVL